MASTERNQAYIELIEALLQCENGQEPALLSASSELVDAGLVATMREVAVFLENEGQGGQADWLRAFAAQLSQIAPSEDVQQRRGAYIELIEALFACEQGQEAEILQANFELVDAGLVATMREVAAALVAQGQENNGGWLNNLAEQVEQALASLPSLEGSGSSEAPGVSHSSAGSGGNQQEYLNFLEQLGQFITENQGNREQVYSLLQAHLALIDNTLAQLIRDWGQQTLSQTVPEEQRELGAFFYEMGQIFYGFNGGNPKVNMNLAVIGYELCAATERQPGLERDLSTTLTNLGLAYRTQAQLGINPAENLTRAIAAYDEAAQIRRQPGLERDLSATLNNLGNAYLTQAQLGINPAQNLTRAIAAYDEAAQIFRQPGLERDLSTTLNNLGIAYQTQAQLGINPAENLTRAIAAYDESAQIRRQPGLERNLSGTLNNLGVAYQTQAQLGINPAENLTRAIAAYAEAAQIRRQPGLERDLSQTLNNLLIAGREMVRQGDWQQGLRTLQSCLYIIKKLEDPQLYAQALYELGRAYEMLSDWVNARLYYRDGLRQFADLDNSAGRAKCLQGLGSVLASQGYLEKGLTELSAAAELYGQLQDESGQAQTRKLIESIQTVQQRRQPLPLATP